MSTAQDLGAETAVREGYEIDGARLAEYLRSRIEGWRGPLTVRQFAGGQSNPTYLLTAGDREYVLRRKPPGPLLASAHAVDREYRVLSALGAHTDVPVPRTYAFCADESVIGTPFYVMERVRGRIFWDSAFPELARAERAAYFDAMNAALAALHSVDPGAIGLADFGKPADYVRRQIHRWSTQYLQDEAAGRVPAMDRLVEWLRADAPADARVAVIHGDFRCDNLIFHPTEPRILAILDWELSTLGDPLADFAYFLMTYRLPTLAYPGLADLDLDALGIPSFDWNVAAYCARTDRESIPDLEFYLVFNLFKAAAICHGIRGRLVRGTAVSARAQGYAAAVERIAAIAWARAESVKTSAGPA